MRAPGGLQTIDLFDEAALEEHTEGVVGIDAANLLDAGLGHRLTVCDHRQRLERRSGHVRAAGSDPCQHGARLFWTTRELKFIAMDEQRDAATGQRR